MVEDVKPSSMQQEVYGAAGFLAIKGVEPSKSFLFLDNANQAAERLREPADDWT